MTGLDEAACHVEAHLAEPNEADIHVDPSLRVVASARQSITKPRRGGGGAAPPRKPA
jgi:hypothetical protein